MVDKVIMTVKMVSHGTIAEVTRVGQNWTMVWVVVMATARWANSAILRLGRGLGGSRIEFRRLIGAFWNFYVYFVF